MHHGVHGPAKAAPKAEGGLRVRAFSLFKKTNVVYHIKYEVNFVDCAVNKMKYVVTKLSHENASNT